MFSIQGAGVFRFGAEGFGTCAQGLRPKALGLWCQRAAASKGSDAHLQELPVNSLRYVRKPQTAWRTLVIGASIRRKGHGGKL